MQTVSSADVESVVVGPSGEFAVTDYLGSFRDGSAGGAQAFMVEQKAALLRPHFHEVDQFQVFVGGSGQVGRDQVRFGTVHYADAFTAYGPICTADDAGVAYLTLRLAPATGAN